MSQIEKSILKTGLDSVRFPNMLGDSHRYKTEKGEISLICPCYATFNAYEIYCTEGQLFDDIERYDTLSEAEQRIKELLT